MEINRDICRFEEEHHRRRQSSTRHGLTMKYIHSNETLDVPEGGKFIYVSSLSLGPDLEDEGIEELHNERGK
jgi:hypothetical protein